VKKSFPLLSLRNGIVHIDGQPRLLVSADYPYYRDDPANWKDRLASLKALGIEVITAYIPWRHHQPQQDTAPDFNGVTATNRNVLGFFALCAELELLVVAKPGPFIHAELNYGGMPDWVCPLHNPLIEPLLNADNEAVNWAGARLAPDGKSVQAWPLPAPFAPEFLRLCRAWLHSVGEAVIRPYQAPGGPIVAIQVGNEGIYSNGQHAPWEYDYSPSALSRYYDFLHSAYGSIDSYNCLHGTQIKSWDQAIPPRDVSFPLPPQQTRQLEDWGDFEAAYMAEIFREWFTPLGTTLPVIINQNPPLETHFGLDAWLTRVEPERWQGVHYGFTNWVGDVSASPSAFDRYQLTAKRYAGPNMEENWGFAELYDPAYVDASTSFYQTLSVLNSGATGFNIYTGVGTAHADANIEILKKVPYPDAAPISAEGTLTPKAEIVRWMAKFFSEYGVEFLDCRPVQPVAWGLYLPHARVAVWSPEHDRHAPRHGNYLKEFQKQMRALHLDYGIANLQTASAAELHAYHFLILAGGERMEASTQQKLVDYVQNSGRLVFLERVPQLDETGAPCEILWQQRAKLAAMPEGGYATLLAAEPRPRLAGSQVDVWVRSHPRHDVHFVTLLIPAHGRPHMDVTLPIGARMQRIVVSAAPSGGALLRIENGKISAAIIKGCNAYLGHAVSPQCSLDGQAVGLDTPGDFAQIGTWVGSLLPEKRARKATK
jgi:beta-galactosidase